MEKNKVLFPQAIIAIAGKEAKVRLINAKNVDIKIEKYPECVKPLHLFMDKNDLILTLLGVSYHPERDIMTFSVPDGQGTKKIYHVPVRVFTEKEFFVVFCLQANYHVGWDPITGDERPDACGSAFRNLYDCDEITGKSYKFDPLERIYHDHGIPITWLIDDRVAEKMGEKIIEWHDEFGDTCSLLPSSFYHDNCVNYNIEKSLEETKELLQASMKKLVDTFFEKKFPIYLSTVGVDYWLGTIGSHFVQAAIDLELKGIWGMGWDTQKRVTGMYHRGAPWNAFKPSKYQFRIPARENEKYELFLFQWTIRDLVNTLHLSPYGAAIFSTDPDDLKANDIIKQLEPNYIMALFSNYARNIKYNDYFVFLIHQEDHDAHIQENNMFFKDFIDKLMKDKPPGITFATLEEVAQWLSIKYPENQVPSQILELSDPLLPEMRKTLLKKRMAAIRQVYDPKSDKELERIVIEHFPCHSKLPLHVAFFDRNIMFLGYKPNHLPTLFWDYTRPEEWMAPEDGQYTPLNLPMIENVNESFNEGYEISFHSDRYFTRLPWIIWHPAFKLKKDVSREIAIQTDNVIIFFINIRSGENIFNFIDLIEKIGETKREE
ncbi:MAG: hypothetical protein ACTSVI_09750 [Promethearchaeota archaeon]